MPNGPDPQILSCGIVLISTDQGLYMNMICSIMNQCLTKKEKKNHEATNAKSNSINGDIRVLVVIIS